ncbi:MAG: hypothetical protein ACRYGP_23225 [Janthinobacterium lividum]
MAILAGLCGVLIVVFGLLTTRHSPTDAQFGVEVTCLVGGLVLIFLGVLLGHVRRLSRVLERAITDIEKDPSTNDTGSPRA